MMLEDACHDLLGAGPQVELCRGEVHVPEDPLHVDQGQPRGRRSFAARRCGAGRAVSTRSRATRWPAATSAARPDTSRVAPAGAWSATTRSRPPAVERAVRKAATTRTRPPRPAAIATGQNPCGAPRYAALQDQPGRSSRRANGQLVTAVTSHWLDTPASDDPLAVADWAYRAFNAEIGLATAVA